MPVPDRAGGPPGSGPAGSAGSAGFGVPVGSPRLVRSARFWLRAYPRRWRAARGEEVLGLLADLAGPGDGRLDARTAVNLVRSGWATRWREHPPLGPWLLYRLVNRRMPGHLGWVRDDIAGRWLPLRANLGIAVFFLVLAGTHGSESWMFGGVLLVLLFGGGRARRQAVEQHLVPRPGEPLLPGSYVQVPAPRRRVAAAAGLPWAIASLVGVAGVSVTAVLVGPLGNWIRPVSGEGSLGFEVGEGPVIHRWKLLLLVGLAVVAGIAAVPLVRRRLRTHLQAPVFQPHRELSRMTVRGAAALLLLSGLAVWVPVAEVVGELPIAMSILLGVPALILVPSTVLAAREVARRPTGLTLSFVDVARIALLGSPPVVDSPDVRLEQLHDVPEGAVVPPHRLGDPPSFALG